MINSDKNLLFYSLHVFVYEINSKCEDDKDRDSVAGSGAGADADAFIEWLADPEEEDEDQFNQQFINDKED